MTKQDEIQKIHLEILLNYYKTNKKAIANLAMRYGKTKLTIDLFRQLLNPVAKLLVCYPDNKLKDVWQEECVKWNYINPNITYVNFSSLWKYENEIFDMVVCDEVHSLSPNELDIFHRLITNDENMLVLGLSGTISKETKERIGIPIIVEYSTQDGIDSGILADYQITVHLVDLDDTIQTKNKKGKLVTEKKQYSNYSYVIDQMRQDGRNSMFLALSRNRLSLSSIGKMTYLKALLLKLKDKRVLVFTGLADVADNIGIPSYHSKSVSNSAFIGFQGEKINHLALAAMGKVGVTYPNLDSVIMMNFTYNAEESAQILNRAIKLDYRGKIADLHILCLNEKPEIKKIKESLSMLNQNKIKYL